MGAVGAIMVTPRLLCLLGAILASCMGQEQELPREAKQLNSQPEQKYDLELSFPVDSVLATNVNDDRRARIDNLIQEILLATQVKCSTDCFIKVDSVSWKYFCPKRGCREERSAQAAQAPANGAFVGYQGLRGVMGPLQVPQGVKGSPWPPSD